MNVLITGAGGFIGKHLVDILLNDGYDIRGTTRDLPIKNIEENNRKITWVTLDLSRPDNDYYEILNDIDVVVHLAARVHQVKGDDDKDMYWRVNVEGTRTLLMNAKKYGIKRFIYLSTIKVMGEGTKIYDSCGGGYSETNNPDPRDAYAKSKFSAEQIIQTDGVGMDYVIIRPPLVYGPGVKGNYLSLMHAVHKHYPLPLRGIRNIRSLIYVENLCDGILTCIKRPEAANNVFHICDISVSTANLVEMIAASFGIKPVLFPLPASLLRFTATLFNKKAMIERLIKSLSVDDSKIRKLLSWVPECPAERGMEATAKWYLENTT